MFRYKMTSSLLTTLALITLASWIDCEPARCVAAEPKTRKKTTKGQQLSNAQLGERLTAFADDKAKDGFSGAVLFARGDKVLFAKAYGLASRRFHVPNQVDTKFNLGSMNKMFTAVAVMQLAQEDELSLDDQLSKYIKDDWLPNATPDKIQIKHLLTHTSGLGSYFNDDFFASSRARFRELVDYKPLLENETLAFEPGSEWAYSNSGMLMESHET